LKFGEYTINGVWGYDKLNGCVHVTMDGVVHRYLFDENIGRPLEVDEARKTKVQDFYLGLGQLLSRATKTCMAVTFGLGMLNPTLGVSAGIFTGALYLWMVAEGSSSDASIYLNNICTVAEAKEKIRKLKESEPTICIECENRKRTDNPDGSSTFSPYNKKEINMPVRTWEDWSPDTSFLNNLDPSRIYRINFSTLFENATQVKE